MASEPLVRAEFRSDADGLHVRYEIENILDDPIYVFDRMWSEKRNSLDANWAYVAISGSKAEIVRQAWPLPRGLHHDSPEVPYSRKLQPGKVGSGELILPLPLRAQEPYWHIVYRRPAAQEVTIESVALSIGWARVADLAAGNRVELEGLELFFFDHSVCVATQRIARSTVQSLRIRGMTWGEQRDATTLPDAVDTTR